MEKDCNSLLEHFLVKEQSAIEALTPGLMLSRQEYDRFWNERKKRNREHNLAEAHGIYYKNKYRHNP